MHRGNGASRLSQRKSCTGHAIKKGQPNINRSSSQRKDSRTYHGSNSYVKDNSFAACVQMPTAIAKSPSHSAAKCSPSKVLAPSCNNTASSTVALPLEAMAPPDCHKEKAAQVTLLRKGSRISIAQALSAKTAEPTMAQILMSKTTPSLLASRCLLPLPSRLRTRLQNAHRQKS